MSILVDYRCPACRAVTEAWVQAPIPGSAGCRVCGTPARRLFGGALLTGTAATAGTAGNGPRGGPAASGCGHPAGVPGGCTLTPTAARMLAARMRGDNRAIDRESAFQERAIAAGRLDPAAPVTTAFPGARPA